MGRHSRRRPVRPAGSRGSVTRARLVPIVALGLAALAPGLAGGVTVAGPAGAMVPRATGTAPVTASVYATREGLVGRRTANGHLILPGDHFVALPSIRALSPRDTGTYSVRVCAPATGRCGYEPVWDVGPWNTRDDYWNPVRPQWTGLPVGLPEAAAANLRGYDGGRDQYGRRVTNPAGIDLADGTLTDLGLSGGAWVSVTFLWTGAGTQGQIRTAGGTLNVRSGPSTAYPVAGVAINRTRVPVQCATAGPLITGPAGSTGTWLRLGPGNYVSAAFVAVDAGTAAPAC